MNIVRCVAPFCALLLAAPAADAAGGGHIVDDAAVETPGDCDANFWLQHLDSGTLDTAFSLACTPLRLPFLEIGAGFSWLSGGDEASFDPGLKMALLRAEAGVSVAIAGSFTLGLQSGRIETARLIVPVSLSLSDGVELNLNAGVIHERGEGLAGHFGAQMLAEILPALSLMGETFIDTGGEPGAQAGLRLTPARGNADFDLYLGHRIDGESDFSVGAGIVLRF